MRRLLTRLLIVCAPFVVSAQTQKAPGWPPSPDHTTIPLWPADAPGGTTAKGPEQDTTGNKDRQAAGRSVVRLGNVSSPTITLYLAHSASADATARSGARGLSRRQLSHRCH